MTLETNHLVSGVEAHKPIRWDWLAAGNVVKCCAHNHGDGRIKEQATFAIGMRAVEHSVRAYKAAVPAKQMRRVLRRAEELEKPGRQRRVTTAIEERRGE